MSQSSADWLEGQADRSLARQRAQIDTAKLLATFVAGIAAALVATALQVGVPTILDTVSVYLLFASVIATIGVVVVDRLVEPNHLLVLEKAVVNGWSDEKQLQELRVAAQAAVFANEGVVRIVRWMLAIQVLLSALTGFLSVMSLLA